MDKLNRTLGKATKGVTPAVMERFRGHSWPGNVQELENVLERAMNNSHGDFIDVEYLPKTLWKPEETQLALGQGRASIKEIEKMAIVKAMEATRGNITRAARVLRVSRNTLYSKIRRFGL